MKKTWSGILLAVLVLSPAFGAPGKAVLTELGYDIYAEKAKIGSIETVSKSTGSGAALVREDKSIFSIVIPGIVEVAGKMEGVVDSKGMLKFDGEVTIKAEGANVAVTTTANRTGDKLALAMKGAGMDISYLLPLKDYDISSIEDLLTVIKRGEAKTLRVLDMEEMKVVKWEVSYPRDETLKALGKKVACAVVIVNSEKSRETRWITLDGDGILVKQEGVDEDGPHTVLLTKRQKKGK